MRPKISWSDLRGERVGVWGLGVEGAANVRRLQELGTELVLVDDNATTFGGADVRSTADGLDELLRCAAVVKSPGISRYRPEIARFAAAGVPVVGGLGLWLEEAPRERVVCITGTKGKSTTTAIAGHLLERLGYRTLIGGNLGQPPYDPDVAGDHEYYIVETSSYQATDVASTPPVVAVTSLHADHLDWHRDDAETYYRDKLSLTSQPGAELTIASGASPRLVERATLAGPRIEWVASVGDPSEGWTEPLGLIGVHNTTNALIARSILVALGIPEADDEDALRDAAAAFAGLDSRLRLIGEVDGVDFVDDSLSTNVLPTLAALDAFPDRRVAVIVGGYDRGIDYEPLAEGLKERDRDTFVLTLPQSGPRIRAQIDAAALTTVETADCADLPEAVRRGFDWARPDGVVLLSPAAPSFGAFRDYRERAQAFADAMATIAASAG